MDAQLVFHVSQQQICGNVFCFLTCSSETNNDALGSFSRFAVCSASLEAIKNTSSVVESNAKFTIDPNGVLSSCATVARNPVFCRCNKVFALRVSQSRRSLAFGFHRRKWRRTLPFLQHFRNLVALPAILRESRLYWRGHSLINKFLLPKIFLFNDTRGIEESTRVLQNFFQNI